MTNKEHLNQILENIAEITGQSMSSDQAINNGHDRFLFLENAPVYGGFRLVNVKVNGGGHSSAFGFSDISARLKYKEMVIRLEGILAGLKYNQNKKSHHESNP